MSWKKGQSGNPSGRHRSSWRTDFDAALAADTKKHRQSIFEHAIAEARTDNTLLAAILRKCLPDMKSIEAKIDGVQPIQLMIAVPGRTVLPVDEADKGALPDAPEALALPVVPQAKPIKTEVSDAKPAKLAEPEASASGEKPAQ